MRFRRVTLKPIYVKILLFGTDIDIARFHRIPSREKAKARVQQAVMRMGKRIPVDVRLIVPQCNDAPVFVLPDTLSQRVAEFQVASRSPPLMPPQT